MQLSLFDTKKWKVRKLGTAMDDIRSRYGSTAILRAVSLTEAGTAIKRSRFSWGSPRIGEGIDDLRSREYQMDSDDVAGACKGST